MKLTSPVLEKSSWADSLRRYPSQYSAVLISGHGHAYKGVAGLKPAEIQEGLRQAHESSGKKVDLLILEACEGANLETLKELGQHARYALVSQDQMWAAGLPWGYLLPRLDELAQTPESLGSNLVKLAGGLEGKVPTLALVDLEKLPVVTAKVEKLAEKLGSSLDGPERAGILRAFSETERFPGPNKPAEGLMGRLSELFRRLKERVNEPDLGDLGGFLQGISQHCGDPAILELAHKPGRLWTRPWSAIRSAPPNRVGPMG
ncbi:MAG: clostripain-related cysteine peptidase [Vulcanimicrobiota bacterium]